MNRLQLIGICAILGITVALIPRIEYQRSDRDMRIYAHIAQDMKAGQGYYPSVAKDLPFPPTQARSVRLPTSSWLLRFTPQSLWFLLDALCWAVALWFAGRLSTRPLLTIVVGGLWLAVAARYGIALYSEIYGLPFAMYGFYQLKKGNDARAALAFGVAAGFRELYAVGLLIGFLLRRSWPWLAMTTAIGLVYIAHLIAVRPYLSQHGFEMRFGAQGYHLGFILQALSPSNDLIGFTLAILVYGCAAIALYKTRDHFTACYITGLALLSAWSLRYYWEVTYVLPLIACASSLAVRAGEATRELVAA